MALAAMPSERACSGPMDEAVASCGLPASAYLVTESLYDDYGTTPHALPRDA